MKWLTIKEINRRSETAKGALKVSYRHWNQLYRATAKELRKAFEEEKIYIDQNDCGLCIFYDFICSECLLNSCDKETTLYRQARKAFDDWFYGKGDWQDWKRAAKALRDKLKELMQE